MDAIRLFKTPYISQLDFLKILFSEETYFEIGELMNKQNCSIWYKE